MLVFCHSRKETARFAKVIRDMALAQDQLHCFLKEDSASKEVLLNQVEKASSADLKDVMPFGIGIHHAGLSKKDRKMVEDLFAGGYI
jgi:pre-mRNA-splicing helicase BRR2